MLFLVSSIYLLFFISVSVGRRNGGLDSKGSPDQSSFNRKLPMFSSDNSELAIASVIERSAVPPSSRNGSELSAPTIPAIHIVLFLVGHGAFTYKPQMPFLMMKKSSRYIRKWYKLSKSFSQSAVPEGSFLCRMRNTMTDEPYDSPAVILPSNTTSDPGFNRKLEILRCPVIFPDGWQVALHRRIFVEILREKAHESTYNSLFKYTISWKTRQNGYGFKFMKFSSIFDPWKVSNYLYASDRPKKSRNDSEKSLLPIINICSGIIRPMESNRPDVSVSMLVEYIQHHLSMGFNHIFLGIFLDWKSPYMTRLLHILQPYIEMGRVSVTSMALEGFDDVAGIFDMTMVDDYVRYIFHQQCLYYNKGIADYLTFLHGSEYLIFPPNNTKVENDVYSYTIQRYLHDLQSQQLSQNKPMPCYYILQSLGVPDPLGRPNTAK